MRFMRFMKNVKSNVKYFRSFVYVNSICSVEMYSHKRNAIARDKNGDSGDYYIIKISVVSWKIGDGKIKEIAPLAIVAFSAPGYHALYTRLFS